MAPVILFLNGPDANLYGLDQSGVYGTDSFETLRARCWKRESFRHHSYIARAATGVIAGLGAHGYERAVQVMVRKLRPQEEADVHA